MNPVMPHIEFDNDSDDHIVAHSGRLVAFDRTKVVWYFGFLPGSTMAKLTGLDTGNKGFTWVLATYEGKILKTFEGLGFELPAEFRAVFDDKWPTPESRRIAKLEAEFEETINGFSWEDLAQECDANKEYNPDSGSLEGLAFLGTVFTLYPSGKYYTPWANSNVTEAEAAKDELFNEVLERIAESHDMFVTAGEGDPCDIFVGKVFDSSTDDSEE